MSALLVSITVFLTIVLALVLGIASGYAAIMGILRAMAYDRSKSAAAAAASLTHAPQGGD